MITAYVRLYSSRKCNEYVFVAIFWASSKLSRVVVAHAKLSAFLELLVVVTHEKSSSSSKMRVVVACITSSTSREMSVLVTCEVDYIS